MTGEMEKNRKQKATGTDESSSSAVGGGGNRQMNESNNNSSSSSTPMARRNGNGDEQPLFKKPRLDATLVIRPEFQCDEGSIILRNFDSLKPDDGNKGLECSTTECVSGECSTCGDIGFQSELFRCTKCSTRLQHTYCSNSYNPRKRWYIGLCNWCELEVARTATTPGGVRQFAATTPTSAGGGGLISTSSKRDHSGSPLWVEKRNAVDCLLGAALRLPSAGLSNMEELLPQATRGAKGRRSPSFDTVEKAKRSGPNCDSAVKTNNKRSSGSLSSSTTTTTTGDGKALKSDEVDGSDDQTDEKPLLLKRSHHHQHHHSKLPPAPGAPANGKDGKDNLRESTSGSGSGSDNGEKRVAKSGVGRSDSEKQSATITVANKSPGAHSIATKIRKSPVRDHDDKSETTVDNTVRLSVRRSPSSGTTCRNAVAAAGYNNGDEERKGKEGGGPCSRTTGGSPGSVGGGEKLKAATATAGLAQDSPSRETTGNSLRRSSSDHHHKHHHHQENGGSARGGASAAGGAVDRKSPGHSDSSAGGSDCSNVTQVQRSGHGHGYGSSARETPLRKSQSFKQQPTQSSRLARPTVIIGKTKSPTIETTSKTPKRFADLKDSKLRRSANSPRVTGAHFKCLSDILC